MLKNNFVRAMKWREVGVPTIPLKYMSKRPIIKWKQYVDDPAKPYELKRFFSNGSNLGVVCGGSFGLVVVDFDDKNGYPNFVEKLSGIAKTVFEKTYRVETPRGMHVYLRCGGVSTRIDTENKIDVKGESSYVVAPCSMHSSGVPYTDVGEFDPENILKIPKPILDSMFPEKEKKVNVDWDSYAAQDNDNGMFPNPYEDINEIRRANPILRYVMDYTSMFPERGGSEYWKGKCPLPTHNDKDPSFWVNVRLGICGCFGNCVLNEKPTDVIGLHALIHDISYRQSVEELGER